VLLYAQTKKLLLHTAAHRCAARLLPYRQWRGVGPVRPGAGKQLPRK